MAFADARGIPNEFWEGGENGTPMGRGPFSLMDSLTIPALHDVMNNTMRDRIQRYENNGPANNPKYGVDTNRDYYFSLESSKKFADFIKGLTGIDLPTGIKLSATSGQNLTVFMMHGYDSTKSFPFNRNRGCVYGQYTAAMEETTNDQGIRARVEKGYIPQEIKRYIDFMTQSLFGYINAASENDNYNQSYFFHDGISKTAPDETEKFRGEWIRHLYGERGERGILSFDIELGEAYNEQVRGAGYEPNRVGLKTLEFFKPELSGFFVSADLRITEAIIQADADKTDKTPKREYLTTSFYEFVKNFYNEKKKLDEILLRRTRD
jgi:hypothetical protein